MDSATIDRKLNATPLENVFGAAEYILSQLPDMPPDELRRKIEGILSWKKLCLEQEAQWRSSLATNGENRSCRSA